MYDISWDLIKSSGAPILGVSFKNSSTARSFIVGVSLHIGLLI